GEEDRLPRVPRLLNALAEHLLHQGVEAARRLIEDEELGARHQGRDEAQLLPIALRVGPHGLRGIEIEAGDQLVPVGWVAVAGAPPEQTERLGAGEGGPEGGLAGHVREAPMDLRRAPPRVEAEERRAPRGRRDEPEQQTYRRGFAGAVGAQIPEDLAPDDLQVEVLEGVLLAVALGQPAGADDGGVGHGRAPRLRADASLRTESVSPWRQPRPTGHTPAGTSNTTNPERESSCRSVTAGRGAMSWVPRCAPYASLTSWASATDAVGFEGFHRSSGSPTASRFERAAPATPRGVWRE